MAVACTGCNCQPATMQYKGSQKSDATVTQLVTYGSGPHHIFGRNQSFHYQHEIAIYLNIKSICMKLKAVPILMHYWICQWKVGFLWRAKPYCMRDWRTNVVATAKGSTRAYARNGYQLNSFPSLLPGGCRRHRTGYSRSGIAHLVQSFADSLFTGWPMKSGVFNTD